MSDDDEDFRRALALSLGQTGMNDDEVEDDLLGEVNQHDEDDGEMMREALARTAHIRPPSNFELNGPGFGARRGDDDELQRAIALSLQSPATADDPINLVDDGGDDEIRRAIKKSLEDAERLRELENHTQGLSEEEQMRRAIEESLKVAGPLTTGLKDDADDEEEERHFKELNSIGSKQAGKLAGVQAAIERAARASSSNSNQTASRASSITPASALPSRAASSSSATIKRPAETRPIPSDPKPVIAPSSSKSTIPSAMPSRAEMEKERLARQRRMQGLDPNEDGGDEREAKRTKMSIAPATSTVRVKSIGDLANAEASGSGSGSASSSSRPSTIGSTSIASQHPYQLQGRPPRDAAGEYFLDGELRHTYLEVGNKGSDPVWSVGDALGKPSEMSLLVMSSYDWEYQFMRPYFPEPDRCPIVIVRPPDSSRFDETNGKVVEILPGLVEVYPTMLSYFQGGTKVSMGSCHMKYAWVFYKSGRLRVIISTANFVERDWKYIENSVFVQDFLLLSNPQPLSAVDPAHDFPLQFKQLFAHIKLSKALARFAKTRPVPLRSTNDWEAMGNWDWSRVTVRLVLSVAGKYSGPDLARYGISRLGQVVKDAGWSVGRDERVVAEYQSSSLGEYTIGWYTDFYRALGGIDARAWSTLPKATKKKGQRSEWPPLKAVFPSLATVDASELGRRGGGTMFVGAGWKDETRQLFHDSNSQRGGVLMHAKALVTIYEPKPNTLGIVKTPTKGKNKRPHEEMDDSVSASTVGGWVYIGSANFSKAAWGNISRAGGSAELNLNNYEMGIVLPLPRQGAEAAATRIVPHKRPARPYGAKDVPWSQKDHMNQ